LPIQGLLPFIGPIIELAVLPDEGGDGRDNGVPINSDTRFVPPYRFVGRRLISMENRLA
jgi:hypothetical protein